MCQVYAIGLKEDLQLNQYDNCYIGVSIDIERRWKGHSKHLSKVGEAIREYGWTFENNIKVLYSGEIEECFNIESEYRPTPNIGLNVAPGGNGGYSSYTPERNLKISKALIGRTVTWANKISETKIKTGVSKGSRNGRALTWILEDPSGIQIKLCGNFHSYCDEHNLTWSVLKANVGMSIPPISKQALNQGNSKPEHIARRINTTGWKLLKEI